MWPQIPNPSLNVTAPDLLYEKLKSRIFLESNDPDGPMPEELFEAVAMEIFDYQYRFNPLYRSFCDALKRSPSVVKRVEKIPFLPIGFFKTHEVITDHGIISRGPGPREATFLSSGTTGQTQSRHQVSDVSIYESSFRKAFNMFYGDPRDHSIFALLPSYEENSSSSLIYMVNDLIRQSKRPHSRFYKSDTSMLSKFLPLHDITTHLLPFKKEKNLLIGVTYALLDLVEKEEFNLKNTMIMETGGMKGRRKEMIREELHEKLCKGFGVKTIHSEYGMTELLSQAYSRGNGIFNSPPWMKILIRDTEDALQLLDHERTGGINVIDLANINSCCFIATQDLGKTHADGSFEVLGRFDNSDIRGCNLLVE
jgi:hypothetical protein